MFRVLKLTCLRMNLTILSNRKSVNLSTRCKSTHFQDPTMELLDFEGSWPEDVKSKIIKDLRIIPNFISEKEEKLLLEEVEIYLKRMKYEKDHWDSAIENFRETERKQWYPHNKDTLKKVMKLAFENENTLPHIHVLDLAADGFIMPHVDSVRYCGSTIAGLSLLSDSVMKLVPFLGDNYQLNENYRKLPGAEEQKLDLYSVKLLLGRKSLYVMSDSSRYNFTHEILRNTESIFRGEPINKVRRISIICRNEPK